MRRARERDGRALLALLSLCASWACSDDSPAGGAEQIGAPSSPAGGVAMGGTTSTGNGAAAAGAAGAPAGSSAGAGGASALEGNAAGTGGGPSGAAGAAAATTAFSATGVCGARARGRVTTQEFQIQEERYLLGDNGFGPDICTIRFDVTRVGDAPPGCDELAGQQQRCSWTHLVQYATPTVVLDENGACANSELGMDADAIAALDGQQSAYGYVFEYQGHNSVIMIYNQERQTWEPGGNAGWDEMTGDFLFDERRGFCNYAP